MFRVESFEVSDSWLTFALPVFLECWNVAMPLRLSAYACKQIIQLWQQGETVTSIMKELKKDGISTTHRTVNRRICQWTKGGGLQDQVRSGQPSVITEEIAEYLGKMLEDDAWSQRSLECKFLHQRFGDFSGWSSTGSLWEAELVHRYRMRIRSNVQSLPNVVLLQRTPSQRRYLDWWEHNTTCEAHKIS